MTKLDQFMARQCQMLQCSSVQWSQSHPLGYVAVSKAVRSLAWGRRARDPRRPPPPPHGAHTERLSNFEAEYQSYILDTMYGMAAAPGPTDGWTDRPRHASTYPFISHGTNYQKCVRKLETKLFLHVDWFQSKVYIIQFELLIHKINWKQKQKWINHVKWFVFLAQIIQLDWV